MKMCETCDRFNQGKIACISCKFDGELTNWKPNKFIQSLIDEAEFKGFNAGWNAGEKVEAFDIETTCMIQFKAWKGQRP